MGQGFERGFLGQSWLAVSRAVAFRWHLKVKEHAAGGWHMSLSLYIASGFLPVVSLRGQLWASPQHAASGQLDYYVALA